MKAPIPWIIKYRPKRIDEVIDQEEAKRTFVEWIKSWFKGEPKIKAALLHGPAGCGKTSLVEAVANEFKMELIEMNASDFRNREAIERVAKIASTKASLFSPRGKIILLDEVDGISATADKGALDAILDLIATTKNPIVLTANDPWDPKLRPLREACLMIAFKRLTPTNIIKALRRICEAEGLICEPAALNFIAQRAEGDLRSAINDLQTVAVGNKRITLDLVKAIVTYRYREYTPFEALRKMFWAKAAWQAKAAISSTNLDHEMLMEWINENLPLQYSDPEDLWRAYEALSRADVYLGRIIRTGSWDLLAYAMDMMSAGVTFARKNEKKLKFAKYTFPQKILLMAKTKRNREVREGIASVLASHLHISRATAKSDVIPFLQVIFRENPEEAAKIAIGLDLTEEMVKYLAGEKAQEVLKVIRELKKAKEHRKTSPKGSGEGKQKHLPL